MYQYNKQNNTITFTDKVIKIDETIKVMNEFIDKLKIDFINEYKNIISLNNDNLDNAIAILRKIHLLKANIAALELETNLTNEDFIIISNVIKKQLFAGISINNVRYGLKHLVSKSNLLSENQIKESLRKYSNSGNLSYHKIKENYFKNNPDYKFSRRFLNANESCPDCIYYASLGKRLIGDLPVPGENCQCNSNCKCDIAYYN